MRTKNGLSFTHIVLIALLIELTLIAMQLVYLKIYANTNPEAESGLTSEYMKTRGFYIFQIIGFFAYTFVVFVLVGKLKEKILNKILLLVVAGGIIELSFYLVMRADYEGAFLYSILDKFIGATFGFILHYYTTDKVKKPDSYL